MTNINIGNKIRQLRKKKGITQESLASVLSVSPQAVSKWESGLTYPDVEIIPIIAGYFEVSMDIPLLPRESERITLYPPSFISTKRRRICICALSR